jgi:energy-coupling factor transport system permease protein
VKFLENMSFGQYVPAQSWVHRLDPRCKIIALILLLTGVFLATRPADWILWVAMLWLCARLSKTDLAYLVRSIRTVLFLIIFTALLNLFLTSGEEIWRWGILSISREGVELAWTMSLRLVLLVLFANLLTYTTSPMALSDGLESLLSPLKRFGFPAHELAMMMTIALRFIPTLLGETERILMAQLARGADLDRGSLVKRMKAFIPVLVPLFVIVFQRADDLAVAMEARCYHGGEGRTRMKPFRWQSADTLALGACAALIAAQEFLNLLVL